MPAYLVATVEIHDMDEFKDYVTGAPPTVEQYGGRYLARGGSLEVIDGDWAVPRLTIVEFATMEQAKKWWDSPEYAKYKDLRHRTCTTNAVFVEGL